MYHPQSQLIGQGESCDLTEGRGVQEMQYCPASGRQRAGKCGRGSRWGPLVCRPSASIEGSCAGLQAEWLSRVRPFATPRTVARQAPLSVAVSRREHWSGLPCPPPGGLPNPGVKPASLMSLHWQAGSSPAAPPYSPTWEGEARWSSAPAGPEAAWPCVSEVSSPSFLRWPNSRMACVLPSSVLPSLSLALVTSR